MNYSEEQIKKALRQFIDDPETAKKYVLAMRKGLEDELNSQRQEIDPLKELNDEVTNIMELQGFILRRKDWDLSTSWWEKPIFGGRPNKTPYVQVYFSEMSAFFADVKQSERGHSITVEFIDQDGNQLDDEYASYSWADFKDYFQGGF